MGKKKTTKPESVPVPVPEKKARRSGTVNVGAKRAEMIAVICTSMGIRAEDYLGPILDAVILADFRRVIAEYAELASPPATFGGTS